MRSLERDDFRFAFDETGPRTGPTLLFIHGWGCDHTVFAAQQLAFSATHRIVAVDLRGHGASGVPERGYSVRAIADDVAWLCGEIGIVSPILIGHSMGGVIALEVTSRLRVMPRALVLIGTALFPPRATVAALRPFARALFGPDHRAALESTLPMLFSATDDLAMRRSLSTRISTTPQRVLAPLFTDHILDYDGTPALTSSRVPMAYIDTEIELADVNRIRMLRPDAQIARTLSSGHFAPVFAAEQIIAMLQAFERTLAPAELADDAS